MLSIDAVDVCDCISAYFVWQGKYQYIQYFNVLHLYVFIVSHCDMMGENYYNFNFCGCVMALCGCG